MSTPSRHSNCSWLATTAASALLLGVYGASAHAAGANAQIHGDGFSPTAITVISENGTSWTKIKDGDIALPVKIKLGLDDHTILEYVVRQEGQSSGEFLAHQKYVHGEGPAQLDFSAVYNGSTDHLSAAQRQEIIASCNSKLNTGKGIHQTHHMFTGVGVKMNVDFLFQLDHAVPYNNILGNVAVNVKCEGKVVGADGIAAKEPNFGVKGIHLRFMTTAGHPIVANPGTRCQLARTKVRVETSKAGAVKFKLWTRVGNEPIQSEVVDAWSSFVGPGKYEASFFKPFHVQETTSVQAMAEDMTNAIGQTSGWKSVTVHCTGAGGEGLASTPGTANPDALPSAKPKAPMRLVPGAAVGVKVAPVPTAPRVPQRVWQGRVVPAPMNNATAAKATFFRGNRM